ncbi:hypothetical protein FB451DRAFT_1432056 [Mycena latifolia]|nr:hypothetical protein FB451DRAFT_1432056 [Mycena latifolia]
MGCYAPIASQIPLQNPGIEPHPTERKVPMQVLGLGFSRTGTASLKIALETLGYVETSHGRTVGAASPSVHDMWIEATKAKFHGKGTLYGRAEWDRLLGDYQAVTDWPHTLFAEDLIAAYPEAKVVLTTRSPDSWWKSFEATIVEARRPTLLGRLREWLDPVYGKRQYLGRLTTTAFFRTEHITEDIAKARFTVYYDEVRSLVPKDRLLEFSVKEGWAPLAGFLGKEVPATPFPRVNDTEQFQKLIATRRAITLAWASKFVGALLAVAAAAILVAAAELRGTRTPELPAGLFRWLNNTKSVLETGDRRKWAGRTPLYIVATAKKLRPSVSTHH